MDLLRLCLLAGLVVHKVVWEILKRGVPRAPATPFRRFVKVGKMAVLAGIALQTLLPDILPIASSPQRLRAAGAVIYAAGLLTAVLARLQLGRNWSDIEAGEIQAGHQVIERGLYAYIRHPIYTGDLLLLLGLELALNSWLVLGLALLAPVVLREAIQEENALRAALPGYEAYCRRTRRFIPFVI